jgi:predicted transcriptional regulator
MNKASENKYQDSVTKLKAELIVGPEVHLSLLKLLEQNPSWTQRQLADALGISLGKTNYCPRALKDKGLVKWGKFSQLLLCR